ncbi:MAG: PAS domain-containing protein [Chthoniobacterales bacterium]|nr:PAS domain-containing protein [Chthoniobacterales bacterium]
MGWLAFALALGVLVGFWWRVRRDWIMPSRELQRMVQELNEGRAPRTFLIGGSPTVRGTALALEQLALREGALRARVQEGEFGVKAIVGALADGLVVADGERRIRLMNNAFRQMFGLGLDQINPTLLETVRDAAVERSLGEALRSGERRSVTIVLQRPAETERHLEVVAEPIKDAPDGLNGAVILFRDITERRRTETTRRDFVANVSHELRTPLSILRGYLETLLENPEQPPAELLRIFEVMERHSNRLNLLVDDVLSLARLEGPGMALDRTTIRPALFLRGIMRDWEKKFAAKQLEAELAAADDLPPLQADEARLQEVIYNLLDNAVKYSAAGGHITIRASSADGQLSLSVSDKGAGIPARDLPRIFERFYRADKARHHEMGGTGLGLSIVKHIVQLHGGSVEAESELGRGTTVRVHLPLAVTQT